ncbi:hypothetical protein [Actinomadura rugatobispora]|uniref:Uncharacterized protein n=1 Tax=Actinomadura rugatobispora TaxID=1994 RepID=A0ABW0ZR00_9ACTN|nr:hypothetical protein GCM10010200_036400 [Actinomadura rugatobispora]
MTDRQLRTPRTPTDSYLAAILDTLGEIRDRLPALAPAERPDGSVELREPAASAPAGGGEAPPPEPSGGGEGPGATAARRPARTSPAKTGAQTTRKRAPKKEAT